MNAMVDAYALTVERLALDFSVTLLVDGLLITGMLTPTARFRRWQREVFARAVHESGTITEEDGVLMYRRRPFTLPHDRAPEITAELRQELAKQFATEEPDLSPDASVNFVCLANAEIQRGPDPAAWVRLPFLVVAADAISALFPGTVTVTVGGAPTALPTR